MKPKLSIIKIRMLRQLYDKTSKDKLNHDLKARVEASFIENKISKNRQVTWRCMMKDKKCKMSG